MASFHIENFGCRAARADGEALHSRLHADGLSPAGMADATVVIVNTCSVTAEADRDARAYIRKACRLNPEARVVVTGCYAQRAPEEIAALPGVAAVVGNSHKGLIPQIALTLANEPVSLSSSATIPLATLFRSSASILGPVFADDSFAHSWIEHAQVTLGLASDSQTRPNLKIQEGCSNRCTFCVIPTTRGGSRSMPAAKVLAQVLGFVQSGGNELVLSGINLGRWGRDIPKAPSFASLVRQILSTTNLTRLRLSSIEPMDWSPELIGLFRDFSNGRLARHAHLPLQSGCDAVLRRMHRRYRPWHYAHKVTDLLAAAGPQLAIGADVMVGFPGETDAEFRQTCDFIASLPFAYLHLFPFSPRPGTPGWDLHRCHPVPAAVVRERMTELRQLADAKKRAFRTSCAGSLLPAITMHSSPVQLTAGVTPALTDNFLPVELTEILPPNQLIHVNIHADVSPLGALRATSQPYAHMAMAI